jgi:hypothetical protein
LIDQVRIFIEANVSKRSLAACNMSIAASGAGH